MLFRNTINTFILSPLKSRPLRKIKSWGGETFLPSQKLQRYDNMRFANTSSLKPFKILGVQQIAIGSTDSASMRNLWIDIFGLSRVGSYSSATENVSEDILRLGRDGQDSVAVEVDLMIPLDEERSPKVHSDVMFLKMLIILMILKAARLKAR